MFFWQDMREKNAGRESGRRRPPFVLAASLAALYLAGGAHAQSGEVEATLIAYAVTLDEDGGALLEPAGEITPGGIIEYEIGYKNATDDPLDDFVVLGDVPDQTHYLAVTAVEGFESDLEVHVPGIGWSLEPVIRYSEDENGTLVGTPVPPEEYDALRWRMPNALAPGEEISVSYRIQVNN
ncbi:MAG: hypothetical protein ABJG15_10600 [Hyphomonadaceae bacterium]